MTTPTPAVLLPRDPRVATLRDRILRAAHKTGADEAVIMAALAEVFGEVAGGRDRRDGADNLPNWLHVFAGYAGACYRKKRAQPGLILPPP